MGGTRGATIWVAIVVVVASACDGSGGGGGGGCDSSGYARVPCKVDSDCHQTMVCVDLICVNGQCEARGPAGDPLPANVVGDCKQSHCEGPRAVTTPDPTDAPRNAVGDCAQAHCEGTEIVWTPDPNDPPTDYVGNCAKDGCDGTMVVSTPDPTDRPPDQACAAPYCTMDSRGKLTVAWNAKPDGTPCARSGDGGVVAACEHGACALELDAGPSDASDDADGDAADE